MCLSCFPLISKEQCFVNILTIDWLIFVKKLLWITALTKWSNVFKFSASDGQIQFGAWLRPTC